MQRIEFSIWILLIIGLVLKIIHVPGYSFFIVFSLLSLCILYFLFSFLLFNKISIKRIFKSDSYKVLLINLLHAFISGIGLSVLMVGILYKLMHYNKGNLLIYSGLTISGIALLWLLLIKKTVNYKNFNMVALRFVVSIGIAITLLIGPS